MNRADIDFFSAFAQISGEPAGLRLIHVPGPADPLHFIVAWFVIFRQLCGSAPLSLPFVFQ